MLTLILAGLLVSLVVGGLGRLLLPGRNRLSIWRAALIGFAGAAATGAVIRALAGNDLVWFLLALLVAAILVGLIGGRRRAGGSRRQAGPR